MKPEIEQLVRRFMDFYDANGLIIDLDISFSGGCFPTEFRKDVRDVIWVMFWDEFAKILEGETITARTIVKVNEEEVTVAIDRIRSFLANKSFPVRLKVLINMRDNMFGICLTQLKHIDEPLDELEAEELIDRRTDVENAISQLEV